MKGGWLRGEEAWGGEVVNGTGMGGVEAGGGEERSDPLALAAGGSRGDAGLLGVLVSAGDTGTGEGG